MALDGVWRFEDATALDGVWRFEDAMALDGMVRVTVKLNSSATSVMLGARTCMPANRKNDICITHDTIHTYNRNATLPSMDPTVL